MSAANECEKDTGAGPMGKKAFETQKAKPVPPPIKPENIPAELKANPRWILWNYSWKPKKQKWDKPPFDPRTGRAGSSTDPSKRVSYEAVLTRYQAGGFDGIGFVFTEDDFFAGIDLDDCVNPETGEIQVWARKIIGTVNSYTEKSPSQTGIKIFIRCKFPPGGREFKTEEYKVEIYETGRYFTVTGHRLDWTPATIEHRQEQIDELHTRLTAAKEAKKAASQPSSRPQTAPTR